MAAAEVRTVVLTLNLVIGRVSARPDLFYTSRE